ncbi:hypothetical protein Tsubulata_025007 [Turnera subulata]|uniref:Uncharacterized protein n=1 Tax=Turnera subulata TaxID=218843 RepID=A0A9Q0FNH6_9ROSI|nr:hypothetical protein Tsubulata_025007 [Turnera subulata]
MLPQVTSSSRSKPLSRWNSGESELLARWNSGDSMEFSDGAGRYAAEVVLEFLEEQEDPSINSCGHVEEEEGEEDENPCDVEETKKFWETQHQLLQATLYRTSSLETKIRQAVKEVIKENKDVEAYCTCRKPVAGRCRECLQRKVLVRLQNEGYNCNICKSKWKSCQDIPPGEHTYLEVVDRLSSKKGEVRVVIELNLRGEFEMARANGEYNQLTSRLPELFVGKAERLKAVIKIMCAAAKMCMKEKKMHLAPWRKHKYMQSKWLGMCEKTPIPAPLPGGFSDHRQQARPKASMLTYDLLESLPVMHCTAVKVL